MKLCYIDEKHQECFKICTFKYLKDISIFLNKKQQMWSFNQWMEILNYH